MSALLLALVGLWALIVVYGLAWARGASYGFDCAQDEPPLTVPDEWREAARWN